MNYCWRIGSPLLNRLFIVDYLGRAAALPGPTVSVDVIITNGVFNLCLDKPKVIAEMGVCSDTATNCSWTGYHTSGFTQGELVSACKPTLP